MPLVLGIDTGGTTTNAVLLKRPEERVLLETTVPTDHRNLTDTIRAALDRISTNHATQIDRVSLSTTLATNAVLENQYGRVGLITAGRDYHVTDDHVTHRVLACRMDIKGRVRESLDEAELSGLIEDWHEPVDAFAVSCFASVKNPSHELTIKARLEEAFDVPVMCAHQLIDQLGFEQRTQASIVNAGLVPKVYAFLSSAKTELKRRHIDAPVYIVKGDGNLMPIEQMRHRALETLLSGPAASLTGGAFLSGRENALVVDIGGTSTDVGLIVDGRLRLNPSGTSVGEKRFPIPAADVRTFASGGDSEIRLPHKDDVRIGPRRILPLSRVAENDRHSSELLGDLSEIAGSRQRHDDLSDPSIILYLDDGVTKPRHFEDSLDERIWDELAKRPTALLRLAQLLDATPNRLLRSFLLRNNLIRIAGLTPTDVVVAQEGTPIGNQAAARLGITIHARRVGYDIESFMSFLRQQVSWRLFGHCVEALIRFEHPDLSEDVKVMSIFNERPTLYSNTRSLYKNKMIMEIPLVGVGAPAKSWLAKSDTRVDAELVFPSYGAVANAVGAAVSRIEYGWKAVIRFDSTTDEFILHLPWKRSIYQTRDEALKAAKRSLAARMESALSEECESYELSWSEEPVFYRPLGGEETVFVEHVITILGRGEPKSR